MAKNKKEKMKNKFNNINKELINKNYLISKITNRRFDFFGNLIKISIFLILSAIILLLIVPRTSALGIMPGRTTIDFEPGLEKTITFSLVNNENKKMDITFSIEGEMSKYISFSEKKTSFDYDEEGKEFSYMLKLPQNLEPGLHKAEIIAMELPRIQESGTYVGATVAVVSQLFVYVPCPGKCIDAELNILDVEPNSTTQLVVPVINRGKEAIKQAKAIIEIYTLSDEKIATINTDSLPIVPGGRTELTGKWYVSVASGEYIAKINVLYDGESKKFEKQFMVGKSLLELERILVSDFKLGDIAKLRILIENRWSQELKNVFANLLVYTEKHEIMSDIKSSSEDIPALSKHELLAYWDTAGISEGEYDGRLMIKYEKGSTDRDLILKIKSDSLDISGVGFAVSGKAGKGTSIVTILGIIIGILVLGNIAWFVFFKRRQQNSIKKK